MRALAELVDHDAVAEDPVHLPVRRDRAEVDDAHVSLGRDVLELFGFLGHRVLLDRGGPGAA